MKLPEKERCKEDDMTKLKGRLKYMGWFNLPWILETETGEVDLWPLVDTFLRSLNGKRAQHKEEISTEVLNYRLFADEKSDWEFEYVPGELVLLKNVVAVGGSNIHAYLDRHLIWFSGRLVEVEISDTEMKFTPDPSEEVHGVHFSPDYSNDGEVPKDIEETVCKTGQGKDCCVFLAMNISHLGLQFSCMKFSPTARTLLDRLAGGTMVSGRIGSCKILAKKKPSVAMSTT